MTTLPADRKANPIKSFIAGGFGGVCYVISCYPLDTIKVRLQTMPRPAPGQRPKYLGTFDCFVVTIRKEGIRGLYRGMSTPMFGVVPMFAIDFGVYEAVKNLQKVEDQDKLPCKQIFLAGSCTVLFTALFVAPTERIKVLQQTQSKYNGTVDCVLKVFKEGGIRSIFKGTCATLLRHSPAGFYFLVYEYLQDLTKQRSKSGQINNVSTIFSGGIAGVVFWFLAMPPDVLKSRLQAAPEGTYKHGVRSVYKDLMAKEGPKALYRGLVPQLMSAFPANAAVFFGMELAIDFFALVTPNF